MHKSKYPVVFGIYSIRYALLLLGLMVVSTGLIVVSIPRWRQRLLQRPERVFSRRQAWVLVISGWVALLVSFVLLWLLLPANDVRKLTIIFVMILVVFFSAALLRVIRSERIIFQIRAYKFYFVTMFLVFITLVVIFHGKLPAFNTVDEIFITGTSWKQINDPEQFISLVPDRNYQTWFNFLANWPVLGIYLKFFGVGILQARFFLPNRSMDIITIYLYCYTKQVWRYCCFCSSRFRSARTDSF